MHEYDLIQALIERAASEARAHGASAIKHLYVRVGAASGVDAGLFTTAYETFRAHTLCASAELHVTEVPARWGCPSCGTSPTSGNTLRCGHCQGPSRLLSGDEIVLDRLTLEVSDV